MRSIVRTVVGLFNKLTTRAASHPPAAPDSAGDPFAGTWFGRHGTGLIKVEIRPQGDRYQVALERPGSPPLVAIGLLAGAQTLRGTFSWGILMWQREDAFDLTRESEGQLRFLMRFLDTRVLLQRHTLTDGSPAALEWEVVLRGCCLLRFCGQADSAMRPCEGGFSHQARYALHADGRFEHRQSASGVWRLITQSGAVCLALYHADGKTVVEPLQANNGAVYLGSERYVLDRSGCP